MPLFKDLITALELGNEVLAPVDDHNTIYPGDTIHDRSVRRQIAIEAALVGLCRAAGAVASEALARHALDGHGHGFDADEISRWEMFPRDSEAAA